MSVFSAVARGVLAVEQALDRLKLAYKERFNRFDPARPIVYRGYGRPDRVLISGRVMEVTETGFQPEAGRVDNVLNTIRSFETDEIRGAQLRGRLNEIELVTHATQEAYYSFDFRPSPPLDAGWHRIEVEVVESMAGADTGIEEGEALIPAQDADFIVISDIDDTVLRTGAANKPSMLRVMLANDAHTREPMEGVADLYRALVAGPSGRGRNPVFYMSRSPWNTYSMLVDFLDYRELPKGPLLLRDAGLAKQLGLERDDFKRERLDHLFEFYDLHRFVLIGDSGQHDPEAYRPYALRWPDRVAAVVIRDVTEPKRDAEVRAIARELEAAGVPMILAENSRQAADRLAELGLIRR